MNHPNPMKMVVLPQPKVPDADAPAKTRRVEAPNGCLHLVELDPQNPKRILRFVRQRNGALRAALAQWAFVDGPEGARQRQLIEAQLRRESFRRLRRRRLGL